MRTSRRRSPIATALAVVLALESVMVVAVRAGELRTPVHDAGAPAITRSASVAAARAAQPATGGPRRTARWSDPVGPAADAMLVPAVEPADIAPTSRDVESAPVAKPRPAVAGSTPTKVTTNKASASASGGSTRAGGTNTGATTFRGRNHVWSPALGIDKPVYSFPCTRSEYPGNVVYRWGCAGRNNVYLFGHAANVFAGVNRAYYSGTLKPGLKVHYADGNGRVRTYAVRWWKVVYPTPDAAWAWASLSRPSMTLQTCVGKNSEKRLMVRLVQVAG